MENIEQEPSSSKPGTGTPSVQTKELQAQILEMRKQGMSYTKIAEQLGYSHNYIYKLYKKSLKAIIFEPVVSYRKMELARLDDLQAKAMMIVNSFNPLVSGGMVVRDTIEDVNGQPLVDPVTGVPLLVKVSDRKVVMDAIATVLKIMSQRALLLGLNAPVKNALTNPDGSEAVPVGGTSIVQVYLPSNQREPVTVENE